MKYAVFDENGFPKAFYDEDIHGKKYIEESGDGLILNPDCKIPSEAIEITDEQWLEFINNQGKRKWNFENNEVVEHIPPEPTLEEMRLKIDNKRKMKVNQLLSPTDYVVIKIQEAKINGDDTTYQNLLDEYSDVLIYRQRVRSWYAEKERQIQDATTIEELESIDIDDMILESGELESGKY